MTAMRLLAYFHPSQDPHALRASLLARGWRQVAMRDGSLWRADSRPEDGWTAIYAPHHPGIARAYAARGAQVVDIEPAPEEIDALPRAATWAVLNPGRHLMAELDAVPLSSDVSTIGVNEAARRVACAWQLCNDGFTDQRFAGPLGDPGRITRRQFGTTIHTGRWWSLDRIGITDGVFSTTCALRSAAASGATTIWLYGHDLEPGNGLDNLTGHWDGSQLANVAAEVSATIAALRASGVRVVHVRWVDGKALIEDGAPAAAQPTKTKRGGRRG
jgi:hypothetical protein